MKKFISKNKMLCIVLAAVLLGAAALALALVGCVSGSMAAGGITTAVSESASQKAAEAPPLSAQDVRSFVEGTQKRRGYIIPVLCDYEVAESKTWQSIKPAGYAELKARAYEKTRKLAKDLFGMGTMDDGFDFSYYTDTEKFRGDFVKVATEDDAIVCVLDADTLDLIEIDCAFVPTEMPDTKYPKKIIMSEKTRRLADRVAASFGASVSDLTSSLNGGGGGFMDMMFDLRLEGGRLVKMGTMNEELYAVAVYPSQACMDEFVYFMADVTRDPSVVRLVAPKDFVVGEPGIGDMTKAEALAMYRKFLMLAGGKGPWPDPTVMTFFVDRSGARENYWHMEGEKLSVDITCKSKWLIHLKCDSLWNSGMDREAGDGVTFVSDYEHYVKYVMSHLVGDPRVKVEPNAEFDYHYCTYDAIMSDHSFYEFLFKDGRLIEVQYFFDEAFSHYSYMGWKADHVYVNTVTGKEFIPENGI